MGVLTQALCVDCGFSITVCGAGTGRTAAYLQSVMLHVSDLVQPYCILRAVYRVCLWAEQCGVMTTSPRREERGESVTVLLQDNTVIVWRLRSTVNKIQMCVFSRRALLGTREGK